MWTSFFSFSCKINFESMTPHYEALNTQKKTAFWKCIFILQASPTLYIYCYLIFWALYIQYLLIALWYFVSFFFKIISLKHYLHLIFIATWYFVSFLSSKTIINQQFCFSFYKNASLEWFGQKVIHKNMHRMNESDKWTSELQQKKNIGSDKIVQSFPQMITL